MPEIFYRLTPSEEEIREQLLKSFSVEQVYAFFLSKNLRSIYQFDEDFIDGWFEQIFNTTENKISSKRVELFLEYARMLLLNHNYENHLKYWIRHNQTDLIEEMNAYFRGEGGE